ncbi:MAG: type II toxin-antitoxin system RelE/ParE family toxin [Cardiobacteriaceae bacterium]|nr:type II toxin-antitoxin system RelE/ParE family toxin [Cardiobacteriaceae bacterium]
MKWNEYSAAYVVLYRYEQDEDIIFILAFRHGKEVGY